MDISAIPKTLVGVAPMAAERPEPDTNGAVATDLPKTQSVQAIPDPATTVTRETEAKQPAPDRKAMAEDMERFKKFQEFSPEMNTVIMRVVDVGNDEIVKQFPEESILRLRTALRAQTQDRSIVKPLTERSA